MRGRWAGCPTSQGSCPSRKITFFGEHLDALRRTALLCYRERLGNGALDMGAMQDSCCKERGDVIGTAIDALTTLNRRAMSPARISRRSSAPPRLLRSILACLFGDRFALEAS